MRKRDLHPAPALRDTRNIIPTVALVCSALSANPAPNQPKKSWWDLLWDSQNVLGWGQRDGPCWCWTGRWLQGKQELE